MKKPKQPLFVAIVGGSGSGKSWLAERLQSALGHKAGRLSLDDFYRDRSHLSPAQRAKINFDRPSAIDWKTFDRVLNRWLSSRKSQVPCYDFRTHCRLPRSPVLKPKPIVLVEGLWLLRSPRIRKFFGFRIFLDIPMKLRLHRRLARDVTVRGRSRSSIQEQFRRTVEPMHRKFVLPQIQWSDFVLRGNPSDQNIAEFATFLRQRIRKDQSPP